MGGGAGFEMGSDKTLLAMSLFSGGACGCCGSSCDTCSCAFSVPGIKLVGCCGVGVSCNITSSSLIRFWMSDSTAANRTMDGLYVSNSLRRSTTAFSTRLKRSPLSLMFSAKSVSTFTPFIGLSAGRPFGIYCVPTWPGFKGVFAYCGGSATGAPMPSFLVFSDVVSWFCEGGDSALLSCKIPLGLHAESMPVITIKHRLRASLLYIHQRTVYPRIGALELKKIRSRKHQLES